MVVLPYVRGVSEELARIYKKRQITSAMKPHSTLRTLLVHPKDKTDPKEGVDCAGCPKKYVGETKRKLKVRVKEHRTEAEKVTNGTRYTRDRKRQSQQRYEDHIWHSIFLCKHYISQLLFCNSKEPHETHIIKGSQKIKEPTVIFDKLQLLPVSMPMSV